MLKTSFFFVGLALGCMALADLAVTTLNPWGELGRMLRGAMAPDWRALYEIRTSLLNTITFALCGIFLGVSSGIVLAFGFHWRGVRWFCAVIRAIHELFWALLLLPLVGLNPICGVLAIAIPYAGTFAKVYSEMFQETDPKPLQGLPPALSFFNRFAYGILPMIYADAKHYTSYRFECALRSSAVLGFIGLPTLGFHLETAFREGHYAQAATILYVFYLLIASLKYWVKPQFVGLYVIVAGVLISKEVSISSENLLRFFTYEIIPRPWRSAELWQTGSWLQPWQDLGRWFWKILSEQAFQGLWNTFLLTQMTLVLTGLITLVFFPLICRHFFGPVMRQVTHYGLIVLRTTPEYILAYVLVQLLGPSMLPAVLAIAFHNGAIMAYLTGKNADLLNLRLDAPKEKFNRYFFEVLPRVYGQFLAFLFYRWEIIMRESAILGILGIYTLGFYIDSAIAEDKMDRAFVLILLTALVNILIHTTSEVLRHRLKISNKFVTLHSS